VRDASLKNVELKLISELMRDCRRSDRELARILGVSRPTVKRMISKLEREGYIQGYSAIPDFSKIGFEILAITFASLKKPYTHEELEKARRDVSQWLNKEDSPAIIGMSGIGIDADRVLVTFHEDYATYHDFVKFIKGQPLVAVEGVKSFLIDLKSRRHFLPLSLRYLSGYILKSQKLGKQK
jgi:DNA-binding Lrp family transcriptional regulator